MAEVIGIGLFVVALASDWDQIEIYFEMYFIHFLCPVCIIKNMEGLSGGNSQISQTACQTLLNRESQSFYNRVSIDNP